MSKKLLTHIENRLESSIDTYLSGWEPKTIQPLDKIFPKERRVHSIITGLATSLGTKLWENVAKYCAEHNGFEILSEKEFPRQENFPIELEEVTNQWEKMRRANKVQSLDEYIVQLKETVNDLPNVIYNETSLQSGEGVDVWIKKGNKEYAFDIKTVQINQGSGLKFNKTLMNWYAYRALSKPNLDFKAYIAFPYNPYAPSSWWHKNGSRAFPLIEQEDVLIENNFWDFLSGQKNTWELINTAFTNLGKKNLANQYKEIFYPENL